MRKSRLNNIIFSMFAIVSAAIIVMFKLDDIPVTTGNKVLDEVVTGLAYLCLGAFIMLIYTNIRTVSVNKEISWLNDRLKLWNSISYRVKVAGEKAFNDMPLGIIVYGKKNRIEWANNYAKEIFVSNLVERSLENLSGEIVEKMHLSSEFDIDLYDKKFHVSVLKDDNIMFFTDKTDLRNLENKYYQRTQVAGFINLDNIEEALASMDAQEHNMIISNIMGILGDWCDEHQIYMRGYSEKQYLILMDRTQLENIMAEEFKVIEEVRNYCYGENLRITLSLGLACFDSNIIDVMEKASEELELALNRGGNQAVVYTDGNVKYYGGKALGVENRTPVYVRVKTEDIVEMIKKASNVFIMTHKDTDADAFGSTLAMLKIARVFKKDSKIILSENQLDNTVKVIYKEIEQKHVDMLDNFIKPNDALKQINDDTLLIITDCQYENLLPHPKVFNSVNNVAIFDHHRRHNTAISKYSYLYNKPSASSTVELIVEMFQYIDEDIVATPMEASLMLLGIFVDTSNLMFRASYQTFNVMSRLQVLGAEMSKVKKFLREDINEYTKKNIIINNVEIIDDAYGIAVCPDEDIFPRQFLAKVSDNVINLNNVKAAFCIGKIGNNEVGVSGRSLDDVNVQVIMEQMGGGGHFNNAATQIKNTTIEEVREQLITVLKNSESGDQELMRIILIKDVKGKGKNGDIIDIPAGHANYLIKSKQAILATVDNVKELERQNSLEKQKALEHLEEMKKLKVFLEANSISIAMKVGKEGQLFGSVSTKQIVDEIKEKYNITLDKRKIVADKDINALGTYLIPIQLHKEVLAKITLYVVEKKA